MQHAWIRYALLTFCRISGSQGSAYENFYRLGLARICSTQGSDMRYLHFVGFQVLKALLMRTSIVWDIRLVTPLEVNRRFGGTEP
jgi:hypothetical protein